jgi:MFS family permease
MAESQALVPATLVAAFFAGLAPALLAALRPFVGQRFQVDDRRARRTGIALRLAMIPAMVATGSIVDHGESQVLLVVASMVLALGLTGLAVSRSLIQAVLAAVLVGTAGGALAVGSLALMPRAFAPASAFAAMNLGALSITLGMLVAAPLAERLIGRADLRQALLFIALLALLPGLAASLTPWEVRPAAEAQLDRVVETLDFWLAAAFLVLYFPVQAAVARDARRYLTELHHGPRQALLWMGSFWLAYLAARLGLGLLFRDKLFLPNTEMWIVFVLVIAAASALGNMAGTANPISGSLGLLVLGVSLGPLAPTVLGKVFVLFPDGPGTACGAACAVGCLGETLLTPGLEGIARRAGVRMGLRIALVLVLILAAVVLVLAAVSR